MACIELLNYHLYMTRDKVTRFDTGQAYIYVVSDPMWKRKLAKVCATLFLTKAAV